MNTNTPIMVVGDEPTQTVREIVLSVAGSAFPALRKTIAALRGTPDYQIVESVVNRCVDLAIALNGLSSEDVPGARIDEPKTMLAIANAAKMTSESVLTSLKLSGIKVVAA